MNGYNSRYFILRVVILIGLGFTIILLTNSKTSKPSPICLCAKLAFKDHSGKRGKYTVNGQTLGTRMGLAPSPLSRPYTGEVEVRSNKSLLLEKKFHLYV
jgi:hypothetical protein